MNQILKAKITLHVHELARLCIEKSLKIATAESCTGGGVAFEMTTLPGSSQWFDSGFVTYSNESKMQLLAVPAATINEHGAVSEAVAKQMALGALQRSQADISLSITGIAGPEGGSDTKPVGLCWFGWASRLFELQTKSVIFPGDRMLVRSEAVLYAITQLIKLIKAL